MASKLIPERYGLRATIALALVGIIVVFAHASCGGNTTDSTGSSSPGAGGVGQGGSTGQGTGGTTSNGGSVADTGAGGGVGGTGIGGGASSGAGGTQAGGSGDTGGSGGGYDPFANCKPAPNNLCPSCGDCAYKYLCIVPPMMGLPDDCLPSGESGGTTSPYCCHMQHNTGGL